MIRHDPKVSQYNPNIKRWGDVDKTLMNGDALSYSVTEPKKKWVNWCLKDDPAFFSNKLKPIIFTILIWHTWSNRWLPIITIICWPAIALTTAKKTKSLITCNSNTMVKSCLILLNNCAIIKSWIHAVTYENITGITNSKYYRIISQNESRELSNASVLA